MCEYVRVEVTSLSTSPLPSQVSGLKPQASSLKSQVSGLRPQASSLRPQVLGFVGWGGCTCPALPSGIRSVATRGDERAEPMHLKHLCLLFDNEARELPSALQLRIAENRLLSPIILYWTTTHTVASVHDWAGKTRKVELTVLSMISRD